MSELDIPSPGKISRDEVPTHTLPLFELESELKTRVEELGLAENVSELEHDGYTVINDIATPEFTSRLREACLRLAQETAGSAKGRSAALLLGRDPIFEEVVLNPKILALVEIMCGKGALLSQLLASIRPKGCLLYTSPSPRD